MKRELARIILKQIGITAASSPIYEEHVKSVIKVMDERCGRPLYPKPGESLALSVMTPKTAALAFDKVYRIPVSNDPVPEDIGFYCATIPEISWWAGSLALITAQEVGIDVGLDAPEKENSGESEEKTLRWLCSEFQKQIQNVPTIFYHARRNCKKAFPTGKHQILTAAISNIAMVEERSLTWEQVSEFRKDSETRKKYRRLVRWIDAELKERSPEQVEGLIAVRLDDYTWALKKHGIKISLGTLSCLLDPKFLGAVSATVAASAVAGGGVWAALAGASLAVGRAAVHFGTALIDGIDERRKNNYEIAYIYEVQKHLR